MDSANSPNPSRPMETEDNLVDEKLSPTPDFKGATLELDSAARNGNDPDVQFGGMGNNEAGEYPGNLDRNRPGSTIGRQSTTSSGSRASMHGKRESAYSAGQYFSKKDGSFEAGVEKCRETAVKSDLDGDIRGAWLLTEIDHWDNEREKIVILCDSSILFMNFDFITQKLKDFKRVLLQAVNEIDIGDFVYPEKSWMPPRGHGGVRVCWGDSTQLSFGQKWNPLCSDIPYISFTHHPLLYSDEHRETVTFSVDDFYETLVTAVNNVYKAKLPGKTVTVVEAPILIESYANLGSMIFNQSHFGFNRDRGGVSF